jgi:hypothetical protein
MVTSLSVWGAQAAKNSTARQNSILKTAIINPKNFQVEYMCYVPLSLENRKKSSKLLPVTR